MEPGLIAVDEWKSNREAYFLTHLHADHINGLSPKWRRGPLYCSAITASLLLIKFPAFDKTLIHILEVGTPSLISLVSVEMLLEVTPIEAHHCPGAVMYLFRGKSGCELYTGDFRWELQGQSSRIGKKQLLTALGGEKVLYLHIDNTFCNPCFDFPPRSVAAEKVCVWKEELFVVKKNETEGIRAIRKADGLVGNANKCAMKNMVSCMIYEVYESVIR